ncbi:response regulator transcription factor [Acidimangrovimonas sediminis]|uniref:response regulator transcription factor n=1 Tax=Acidimangrovimonas sediminis TaxID=2056283 RepID=UPI000C8027F1|nr:response regulator transcription factor [Acidimangrovimonas sediminis]
MYVYVYEAREGRRGALMEELRAARLQPIPVEERFFTSDLTQLNRKGADTRAILIGSEGRGIDFLRAIRAQGCRNPVILLRDFKNARDAAQVLDAGADDVMIAPIKGVEVVSRINAINRRAHGHSAESVTVGEVRAFFDGRDPEVSGERVKLSRREHAIFQHLVLSANRVVSRAAIYDAVYGMDDDQPFDKVIDVYICKLRKKISTAAASGHQYIETVYGRGYKFSAAEVKAPEPIAAE